MTFRLQWKALHKTKKKNTSTRWPWNNLSANYEKEEEEAVEVKQYLKEMLRNVENVDARVERTRQRFSEEFDSCLNRWRREEGRVGFLSTQTYRKSQSSDTKSLNIGKDLNENFRRFTENDG